MIYNTGKAAYEPVELDKFRRLTSNFYIYKNKMYSTDSRPIETGDIDLEKLQPIRLHGKAIEFYTDGKYLFGGYNLGKLQTEEKDGKTVYKFVETPFQDVDWPSLQVIDEKMMTDKNNIYQESGSMLQIIPIKDLGLKVQVVEVLKN